MIYILHRHQRKALKFAKVLLIEVELPYQTNSYKCLPCLDQNDINAYDVHQSSIVINIHDYDLYAYTFGHAADMNEFIAKNYELRRTWIGCHGYHYYLIYLAVMHIGLKCWHYSSVVFVFMHHCHPYMNNLGSRQP